MNNRETLNVERIIENFNENAEFRKKVNLGIAQSGILLEDEAESTFLEKGYSASSGIYQDVGENHQIITREIDIIAFKDYEEISNNYFTLAPRLRIVCECKYSGDPHSCLIVKRIRKEQESGSLLRLPIFLNGFRFFSKIVNNLMPLRDFYYMFGKHCVTRRVVNFTFEGLLNQKQSRKRKTEETVYDICESQILPSSQHFYMVDFKFLNIMYEQLHFKLIKDIRTLETTKKRVHIPIYFLIPMIITNKKILEIETKPKSPEVSKIKQLPFTIYKITPSNLNKFKILLENWHEQDVFVINNKKLSDALDYIDKGIKNIVSDIQKNVYENPQLLIIDRDDYLSRIEQKIKLVK